MNTEEDDDEAYDNKVNELQKKLAEKSANLPNDKGTGDKGIDDNPGPELGEMPNTRNVINRKLKQKLK